MTSASTVPLPMGSTEHVFPARPVMLREIRAFIARLATAAGIPDTELHRIVLAANEAATNAVEHSGSDVVRVGWEHGDQGVWITVADDGRVRRRRGRHQRPWMGPEGRARAG